MVLHNKSDSGFDGYRVPELPQGSRLIRKKRSNLRRSVGPDQMDAMDLLATVAGMLLVEKGKGKAPALSIATSGEPKKVSVFKGIAGSKPSREDKPAKAEEFYHGSSDGGASIGQTTSGSAVSGSSSIAKAVVVKNGSDHKCDATELPFTKVVLGDAYDMEFDSKPPPALASSDSSVDVCEELSPKSRKDGEDRRDQRGCDDDENSSGCTHPGPISHRSIFAQRTEDRSSRKLYSSKFWKVGPTLFKDGEYFGRDMNAKPMFRSRKVCCKRQRTQRSAFKRRKLYERCSSMPKSMEKCIKVEGSNPPNLYDEDAAPSFLAKPKPAGETEDYKVKLRIKSFKIPELFLEMPENATVGSLKRNVLETVTAMLGNGLRVGLILQGRKVRDDKSTLLQAGITRGEKLDTLGFTLEPTQSRTPALHTCESPEPLARLPALPTSDRANPDPKEPARIDEADPEPDHQARTGSTCMALVQLGGENGKLKRSEMAQRRIRRPFSVAEVEALVHAVEKLGTGRWRDVKLRAFEDSNHRTYVDLKDKWKTLVHTAKISPQQRRGEPVPQELLDRCLAAHAYWSQNQPKVQAKQHQPQQPKSDLCLLQT